MHNEVIVDISNPTYGIGDKMKMKQSTIENLVTIGMWISIVVSFITIKHPHIWFLGIILAFITAIVSLKVENKKDYVLWKERAVLLMVVGECVLILVSS